MPKKRTYADRAPYIIQAVKKRRLKLRALAKDYRGGKCEICDYSKCERSLSFHHINPKEKLEYLQKDLLAHGTKSKQR